MPEAGTLLDRMTAGLAAHGVEAPLVEAVALMAELRGCNRLAARIERHVQLSDELFACGLEVLARRLAGEPWQYIFQRAYFRDLELHVDEAVLIPRPETEILAGWCIDFLPQNGSLLDLGTGSGAIALAVATERPDAQVTACDVSPAALAVARRNGRQLAPGRIEWLASDLFSALPGRRFDIIAANLPYVAETEFPALDPAVRDHEPTLALTSGHDGLDLIRRAAAAAKDHLHTHGAVIFELAPAQALTVSQLLADDRSYSAIEIRKDYAQRDRFVAARRREPAIL